MKKFFAWGLSLCLSLSIMSVPVHACEATEIEETENVSAVVEEVESVSTASEIMPREVKVLWSADGVWFIDSYYARVTPAKGTNLKLVISADDVCKIEVTKNGGWWPSKTVTYQPGSGGQTIDLINNCNGEQYTVKFTNNTGVTIAARLVQTEYT